MRPWHAAGPRYDERPAKASRSEPATTTARTTRTRAGARSRRVGLMDNPSRLWRGARVRPAAPGWAFHKNATAAFLHRRVTKRLRRASQRRAYTRGGTHERGKRPVPGRTEPGRLCGAAERRHERRR